MMKLKSLVQFVFVALPLFLSVSAAQAGTWVVTKNTWSAQDEANYQQFVVRFGQSKCNTVDSCFKDPQVNPWLNDEDRAQTFTSDCGRLPYIMRMYFAYKNGLPFSAVTWVGLTPEEDGTGRGLTNSVNGNIMKGRQQAPSRNGRAVNYWSFHKMIMSSVFTGNYRFDAQRDMTVLPDFYPVKMDRTSIHPGTIIYDPSGHVATVYDINAGGDIRYVDAHPDNTVSRKLYNKTFERSRPAHGAGFKNFRPFTVSQNVFTYAPNSDIPDFSMMQFFGTNPDPSGDWTKGKFVYNNRTVDYYEYLQLNMATTQIKFNPLDGFKRDLGSLCDSLQLRSTEDIPAAVTAGIPAKPHPDTIPGNIYSSSGDWEDYSTPGRDFRARDAVFEMIRSVQQLQKRLAAHDPLVEYSGPNLKQDVIAAAKSIASACIISYTKSDGAKQSMNLLQAVTRLNVMSFDPYQCVERRWGAAEGSPELSSCQEDQTNEDWYAAERFLRNKLDKNPTADGDMTLEQTQQLNAQSKGVYNYDLIYYLQKYL